MDARALGAFTDSVRRRRRRRKDTPEYWGVTPAPAGFVWAFVLVEGERVYDDLGRPQVELVAEE